MSRVQYRSAPLQAGRTATAVEITPARAGWKYVHFAVRQVAPGTAWKADTGREECCLVLLRGTCRIEYPRGEARSEEHTSELQSL